MEIKLFTGLIDALGKVADGLKAIVKLPKGERETIRKTLDETNRLVDTTLNMVIIRLGDTLLHAADDDFLREAARLGNYNEWIQVEREFRLCRSLRVALRETQTLAGKLTGHGSTKDWDALLHQMQSILATEDKKWRCSLVNSFSSTPATRATPGRTPSERNPYATRSQSSAPRSSPNGKNSSSKNSSSIRWCSG